MPLAIVRSLVIPALSNATFATFAALATTAAVAGCASQSPDPPTASPTGVTAAAAEPLQATMTTPPLDRVRRGGSFLFSLDESSPAARWHAQCGKESGGDAVKAEACYGHIREVGSHEGMRFTLDAQQRVVLTSFGLEDGKDAVYLEGPLSLRGDGEHALVATFAAPPHGLQVEGSPVWQKPFRFEFPDESTLIMNDEVKGRLVFHRAQP
jgi:hypothetical protein